MVNDSVSDILTRLRNAAMRQAATVDVPTTRFGHAILEAIVRSGYLERLESVERDGRPMLRATFKYVGGSNVMKAIRQLSTCGLRRYSSYKTLRAPRRGGGILLLSTPAGVLTDREARQRGVGGELLCEIHA